MAKGSNFFDGAPCHTQGDRPTPMQLISMPSSTSLALITCSGMSVYTSRSPSVPSTFTASPLLASVMRPGAHSCCSTASLPTRFTVPIFMCLPISFTSFLLP